MSPRTPRPVRPTPLLQVYRILTLLALVLGAPYLIYRRWKHPEEMHERFGHEPASATTPVPRRAVWVHAASLGEVEAVRAWMEDSPLRDGAPWFVTVTSTSARRRAPERFGPDVAVRFTPLDQDRFVRRFLTRHEPRALVLVETELWPVTLDHCRRAGIPVYVVSGRISARGWSTMRWAAALYREVASAIRAAAVQTQGDVDRFSALGIEPTEACGNVKYRIPGRQTHDGVRVPDGAGPLPDSAAPGATAGVRSGEAASDAPGGFRALPIWVIGSLRKGEELLLRVARQVTEGGGYVVVAPRHLRERSAWIEACRKEGLEPVLRSETDADILANPARFASLLGGQDGPDPISAATQPHASTRRVLLVDVHGELREWYARAAAASVGGTWMDIGGHNVFEPLSVGVPVSFGPYVENVRDVADAALIHGGGFQTSDPAALLAWALDALLPASRQKTERSALHTARMLAGAGERTRACLSAAEALEVEGGIFRP
ncbi:MAG: glycosyltransferase N-terminal domain-containing protein [Candidatus Eisenbacteria bacterium]